MKAAVRGDEPRTATDARIQREVVEYVLTKNGLSHRAIHGIDADVVSVRKRHDLGATTRRVAARFGRRRVTVGLVVAAIVTATTGVVVGLESTVALSIVFALASVAVYRCPDWCFERPGPAFERGAIVEDGMTDRAVMRRFAIHSEREAYRAAKIEEQRKRNERKAKARQGLQ